MAQRIRFHTDEHIPMGVIRGVRRKGIQVITTVEAGLLEAFDEAHFEFCREHGLVLFTQDEDFLRLSAAGHQHCGVVYTPQGTLVGAQVRGLLRIYKTYDADQMINRIEFIK